MILFKYKVLILLNILLYFDITYTITIDEIENNIKSKIAEIEIKDTEKREPLWQIHNAWFKDSRRREQELLDRERELLNNSAIRERELLNNSAIRERELLHNVDSLTRQLMEAKHLEIILKPRTILDDIENDLMRDYTIYIDDLTQKYRNCETEIQRISSEIKNIKNKLNNPKLSPFEISLLDQSKIKLEQEYELKVKQKKSYEPLLPPKTENVAAHRELKRTLRWKWALKYKTDNAKIEKLVKKITKEYNEKPDDFKKNRTLEAYKDQFCNAMAKLYEEASRRVAHAVAKISIEQSQEFEQIRGFGDDLDEFVTILINAVGLRLPKAKTLDEMFKVSKYA